MALKVFLLFLISDGGRTGSCDFVLDIVYRGRYRLIHLLELYTRV